MARRGICELGLRAFWAMAVALSAGCGDDAVSLDTGPADAAVDTAPADTGPLTPASTDHCAYESAPATGGAGGTVTAGPLTAGVAEVLLDLPLGTSLGAYTGRTTILGSSGFLEDPFTRTTELAGVFSPSIGIETIPRALALALSAGGETVIIVDVDLGVPYQGLVHDVEARLGPELSGKVIVAASHSHSAPGNYTGHTGFQVGLGRFHRRVYEALLDQVTRAAEMAVADLRPARIGFHHDGAFDLDDRVNRDRREQNDALAGGPRDDHDLFVIRVDEESGAPMALVPIFGMHGTLQNENNVILSTDAPGAIDRVLAEAIDGGVFVMHLQGAAGDVSPVGSGATDCGTLAVCADFARAETVGIYAAEAILAAWTAAGESMVGSIEMEMLTRTIPLGPDWETFDVRGGDLVYAPFDLSRVPDRVVFDAAGELVSPIDEFNAPYGATLCLVDSDEGLAFALPGAGLPGGRALMEYPYFGCNRVEGIADIFAEVFEVAVEEPPLCESTRAVISALRLGDHLVVTLPGEPVTLLADHVRALSPVPPERTIVVGYAQDYGGYLLRPEDWLAGGYEPSLNFWGPLEGEYVAEQLALLMPLALTPEREDGNASGVARVTTPTFEVEIEPDVSSLGVGTVPASLPPLVVTRLLRTPPAVQPAPSVQRLDTIFFTFIGDDPLTGTPRVFLQRETAPGIFEDVTRRSGRPVQDGDLILTWTPDPITRTPGTPRNHYFTVELQAVTPLGMPGLEGLDDRVGMPLGAYRFRVEGPGYELTSDAFEVTPATLRITSAARGADLEVRIGVEAPNGYRLLDLIAASNGFVPLREETVRVSVDGGASVDVDTDVDGTFVLPGGAGASTIDVSDRFGNTGTTSL